ncbi:MAG: glycoside hydrolase family 15 [Caulobacter sp.]|nr:glycoside hydrolase family 15 [Caulobacter sp.]
MTANLNLWPIGNCQVSALIDERGRYVWGCVPRADGDPVFCALVDGEAEVGLWDVVLEDHVRTEQAYLDNTPVLTTRLFDKAGGCVEIVDFSPRFIRSGRMYRPMAFVRILRPIAGAPRIRIRLRPATDWGGGQVVRTRGSNHLRYETGGADLRLTTDGAPGRIEDESVFRLERPIHLFLGPDEPFEGEVAAVVAGMLEQTVNEWRLWVRGLATPVEWQAAVIRSAITLKLCQHEETGAIVAAMTTSIPEHAGSGRNWDYRYCWIRDAYYTVQALNRLGALDVLEGYLEFLRNLVDDARGGHVQPLYGIGGETVIDEREAPDLAGYRGMGPVRVGNAAYTQVQHDVYGQIVLSSAQAFFDRRLLRMSGLEDFRALEAIGERAWLTHDQPDAGLWELRTKSHVHTYSAAMCWAACDRLARVAATLDLEDRALFWAGRAEAIRVRIEEAAWRADTGRVSAVFGADILDASLIQLLDLGFLRPDDPRFLGTLEAVQAGLRRGSHMLRYAIEDDFGLPKTAFNVCTYWLIEALHFTGQDAEARALFEEMLSRLTPSGLLSEDIDPHSGELWGNFPQTYSLVGLINCAVLLSKPWREVR